MIKPTPILFASLAAILGLVVAAHAQVSTNGPRDTTPDGTGIVEAHANDFRALLDRYPKDRRTIEQGFPSRIEDRRIATLEKFFKDWHKVLHSMDFKGMNRSG